MHYTSHFLNLPDDVLAYLLNIMPMSDLEQASKVAAFMPLHLHT